MFERLDRFFCYRRFDEFGKPCQQIGNVDLDFDRIVEDFEHGRDLLAKSTCLETKLVPVPSLLEREHSRQTANFELLYRTETFLNSPLGLSLAQFVRHVDDNGL